ncbi:MAG: hypothetical protein AXA67_08930 [Methylothermaceae bacteria B42]|nr:MAG: hypothetical protein AXA67_08930 [Methylothermaceae bacteria B42]HHJ39427.1 signal recognition particle-docking protein FtsY [Methylothermaceae bacterium]
MWYRKLALFTILLALLVLASGVYVRATGSGLSCPDWPTCFGQWRVPDVLPDEAQRAFPGVIFDAVKAKAQMGHRYLAFLLGFSVALLFGLSFARKERGKALKWSGLLLLLYGLQAAVGSGLIAAHLRPEIVIAHLLLAMLIAVTSLRIYLASFPSFIKAPDSLKGLRRYGSFCFWILFIQIALGGWVSANYAGLACPDFPTCQGSWWPEADYKNAFGFWQYWGGGLEAWALPDSNARVAIHWVHRLGAVVTFLALFFLGISISSNPKVPHLSKLGLLINFLLLVVITLGMALVIKQMPVPLAVAHSIVAALLLMTVTAVTFFLSHVPASITLPQEAVEAQITPPPEKAGLPPEVPPAVEIPQPPPPETLFERLKSGLGKTRQGLTGFLASLPLGKHALDEDLVEEIENQLLMADVGVEATQEIVSRLQEKLRQEGDRYDDDVMAALRDTLKEILQPCSKPLEIDLTRKPFVILVVGVNGVGKTTTIGKLAHRLKQQGLSVMLAAGDTFRAAAVEQLKVWGERNGVPVVAQDMGADSASVVYDALQSAKARGIDVLIADTAGRLHTKSNLMEELSKIKRILAKLDPTAPHEVLLVLDATTGQNALAQADQFNQAVGVTGIALTKLDGTAKGGVIFALAKRYAIPIRFIGIGEGMEDLQEFNAQAFVDALFSEQPKVVH